MSRIRTVVPLAASLMLLGLLVSPYRSAIKGQVLAVYDLAMFRQTASPVVPVEARLVAHAGGAMRGITYTNSREALDEHYRSGLRCFEVDLDWTSDGALVLVHDWSVTSAAFGTPPHVFSLDEFVRAHRTDGFHQLTFADLAEWLRAHPDALLVTDTKASSWRLMAFLERQPATLRGQLILQVYRLSELDAARRLGPRAVWLTLYKCSYPLWALRRMTGFDAVVLPIAQYARYHDPTWMSRTRVYVHPVPANRVETTLQQLAGIYGAYVD